MSETTKSSTGRISSAWLLLSLLLAAHLPFVVLQYYREWQLEHYQFFPFALILFAILFQQRRIVGVLKWDWLSWTLLAIDLVLLAAGLRYFSPWCVCVAAGVLLLAVCRSQQDRATGTSLVYLMLLPLLTLRLPFRGDLTVIQELQAVTTRVAGRILDHFGFLHLRDGNVLTFPGKQFMVEEACSGVQSLFTVLFLSAAIICIYRRRWLHGLLLLGSSVAFAGMMNVLRVTAISVAWASWQVDLSSGWQHDLIGYASLIFAALCVVSADCAFSFLFAAVPSSIAQLPGDSVMNPMVYVWNKLFAWPPGIRRVLAEGRSGMWQPARELSVIAAVVCLGSLSVQGVTISRSLKPAVPVEIIRQQLTFSADDMPDQLEEWRLLSDSYSTEQRGSVDSDGEFTSAWLYAGHGLTVRTAMDHPFCGWHTLEVCYQGIGWSVVEQRIDRTEPDWPCQVFLFQKPGDARYGLLVYSLFEADGQAQLPPEPGSPLSQLASRLRERPTTLQIVEANTYQSQVFCESPVPFTEDQIRQAVDLHFASRQVMRTAVIRAGTASEASTSALPEADM